jgi:hypothetical protein
VVDGAARHNRLAVRALLAARAPGEDAGADVRRRFFSPVVFVIRSSARAYRVHGVSRLLLRRDERGFWVVIRVHHLLALDDGRRAVGVLDGKVWRNEPLALLLASRLRDTCEDTGEDKASSSSSFTSFSVADGFFSRFVAVSGFFFAGLFPTRMKSRSSNAPRRINACVSFSPIAGCAETHTPAPFSGSSHRSSWQISSHLGVPNLPTVSGPTPG